MIKYFCIVYFSISFFIFLLFSFLAAVTTTKIINIVSKIISEEFHIIIGSVN